MSISLNIKEIQSQLPLQTQLVAVSKFHTEKDILEAYSTGQRIFGESKVQELLKKQENLPKDIQWHFIGHLQTNKVKYIAPFISLIHSVDSLDLLEEINKQAQKANRIIPVLMQIHIAKEDTKFGFSYEECENLLSEIQWEKYAYVKIHGLMGMATNTDNKLQIRSEYQQLAAFYKKVKKDFLPEDTNFKELSMGMSDDYQIAIEEGSTFVRIGSSIFGARTY